METSGTNKYIGVSESAQDAGSTNTPTAKQATGKQLVAIVFILAIATKMFLLPIFLIRATGRDAYIALSIGGAFDLIMLGLILLAIKLNNAADVFELLSSAMGKVGAKIAAGIIALFFFAKLNIAVAESLSFYGNNVFGDFSAAIMIFAMLFFFISVGTHTLRALCRMNELLIPVIVVCMAVLIVIVVMTGVDLANIFPSLRDGAGFKSGLVHHAAWCGDFTPLILFIGRTKMKKHTGWFAAASGVIGVGVAVFFAVVMSAAFGNVPLLADTATNLSSILQFTIGNVYGRIDMFSSILWSLSVFIESALFFYSVCRCTAFVIGKNAHMFIALGVCVALYFSQVFVMTDPSLFTLVVTSAAFSITVLVLSAAIPVAVLICAVIGKARARGSKPNNADKIPQSDGGRK